MLSRPLGAASAEAPPSTCFVPNGKSLDDSAPPPTALSVSTVPARRKAVHPMARKRRRSEAFVADPIAEGEAIVVDVAPTDADTASVIQDGLANPVDEAQLEKAGEIWNALKEEYYESTPDVISQRVMYLMPSRHSGRAAASISAALL